MMVRAAYSLGLIMAMSTPAFADWGGIAVHSGSYDWGYSAGWSTRGEARDRALFYCREQAGQDADCEVILTTPRCGALARGTQNGVPVFFSAERANAPAAATDAMAQCTEAAGSSCSIRLEFCADDL